MADSIDIARVPTNEERQDFKALGGRTPLGMFLSELAKVSKVFVREHEPFDEQCAKIDFGDELERIEKESQRKFGFVRESDIRNLTLGSLEKYGDKKRFELLEDDDVLEFQNINSTRTAVVTGHNLKWVCKNRGHGCTVFVPLELYKERFEKKKKVVEE